MKVIEEATAKGIVVRICSKYYVCVETTDKHKMMLMSLVKFHDNAFQYDDDDEEEDNNNNDDNDDDDDNDAVYKGECWSHRVRN